MEKPTEIIPPSLSIFWRVIEYAATGFVVAITLFVFFLLGIAAYAIVEVLP
jgi:hypothetical protein